MAQVRVEITAKNEFWRKAIWVEWEAQFPDRPLLAQASGHVRIETEWLADLERVAAQCFGQATVAPADPGRRQLFRSLWLRGNQS